ncbi:MAG: class I SAM-dependent methyltransferase [Sulfurospirillum sp.]|nr:class I SAM-dependent methyltransferase [Sulfurospirillum sp.]
MQSFWTYIAKKIFKKIKYGNLVVTYPDNCVIIYGDEVGKQINLHIRNGRFFRRLLLESDIGFAQSYLDDEFTCNDLVGLITLGLKNSQELGIKSDDTKLFFKFNLFSSLNLLQHRFHKNTKTQAKKNIAKHYDLSNDFYTLMLDKTMMYSSAIFERADEPLHVAQLRKIKHLADKLRLKKGDKILEIGSGWGAMALHLAQEWGCEVTTVTLSQAQKKMCETRFLEAGVEERIEILLQDYRDLQGQYDAIIAVEMFEAVGKEYFEVFFKKCESLLKPDGVMVMQVITMPDNRYEAYAKSTDFIQQYIFPGGHLPSVAKMLETTAAHTRLNLIHLEEFGEDYAKTLQHWYKNFTKNREKIRALGFDIYFEKLWGLYLNYCEAAFATKNINLVQLAFSRDGNDTRLHRGVLQ